MQWIMRLHELRCTLKQQKNNELGRDYKFTNNNVLYSELHFYLYYLKLDTAVIYMFCHVVLKSCVDEKA